MEAVLAHTTLQHTEDPTTMRERERAREREREREREKEGGREGGREDEPLNNASASGTHDHSCRLQSFSFLAYCLTSIPFHDPSLSPYLFHQNHL